MRFGQPHVPATFVANENKSFANRYFQLLIQQPMQPSQFSLMPKNIGARSTFYLRANNFLSLPRSTSFALPQSKLF